MADDPYYDDVGRQADTPLTAMELKELRLVLETQRAAARFRRYVKGRIGVAGLGIGVALTGMQLWDKIQSWLKLH